jgi:hypothetical protein
MGGLRAVVGGHGTGGLADAPRGLADTQRRLAVVALLAALWFPLSAVASLAIGLDQLRRLRRRRRRSSLGSAGAW